MLVPACVFHYLSTYCVSGDPWGWHLFHLQQLHFLLSLGDDWKIALSSAGDKFLKCCLSQYTWGGSWPRCYGLKEIQSEVGHFFLLAHESDFSFSSKVAGFCSQAHKFEFPSFSPFVFFISCGCWGIQKLGIFCWFLVKLLIPFTLNSDEEVWVYSAWLSSCCMYVVLNPFHVCCCFCVCGILQYIVATCLGPALLSCLYPVSWSTTYLD